MREDGEWVGGMRPVSSVRAVRVTARMRVSEGLKLSVAARVRVIEGNLKCRSLPPGG